MRIHFSALIAALIAPLGVISRKSAQASRFDNSPFDPDHHCDVLIGMGPGVRNFRDTINGYQYADGPMTLSVRRR